MATARQIERLLCLLERAGYSPRYMDRSFMALGATERQCRGYVLDWLRSLDADSAEELIAELSLYADTEGQHD